MKIDVTKQWCMKMAQREAGAEVGAGLLAADPIFDGEAVVDDLVLDESRLAFGRFVNLMRRGRGLTIEQLAESADVEVGEIMSLEESTQHLPDVRTVHQMASIFSVSQGRLMELSGLSKPKDVTFVEEAVRYAARSESIEALTAAEQAALDGFISVLSEKTTK